MDRVRASSVMQRSRVNIDGIMRSARNKQGLEHLDQIRFAVLEAGGEITIIPRQYQAKRRYRGVRHVSLEEGRAGWGTWTLTRAFLDDCQAHEIVERIVLTRSC